MRRSSNYTKKVTCDTWVTRESLYIPESPEVLFQLDLLAESEKSE
jgi:hypothetical protein